MKIGYVARQLGIPASTIRYYEKRGLIGRAPRVSGRRQFDAHAIFVLRFIRLAQAVGFTLTETKFLLESYARNPRPAGVWKPFAKTKRAEIQKRIATLRRVDRALAKLNTCTCASLETCVRLSDAATFGP
jgi:DNA-binding transcriptional MerR regulator